MQPRCRTIYSTYPRSTNKDWIEKQHKMSKFTRRNLFFCFLFSFVFSINSIPMHAASAAWMPVGPDGGDARSFAPDASNPKHIYLGTTNSWIYQSEDGGSSWKRLAKLSKTDDLIVDNILVDQTDPKTLFVATWVVDHPDGGLFISSDQGAHWKSVEDMQGQSIRALAQSASDPKTLIAGTLKGVYRSEDKGLHWKLRS